MSLEMLVLFAFGLLWGSFLNVLIFRYNTGHSFVRGRSKCFSCESVLGFFELVPLFSYFSQRGKCLKCGSSVSPQYPLVEFLSGMIFVFTGEVFSPFLSVIHSTQFLFIVLIFSALLVISMYDFRHKIIPDFFVYGFILLSFFYKIFIYSQFQEGDILTFLVPDVLSSFFAFLFFFSLWFLSKGKAMGFGDAKLAIGLGLFLGPLYAFLAVLYSFWMGAVVSIILLCAKRKSFTIKSEIPFGPFLVAGGALVFFFDFNVFNFF